jgi:hypothetical protein
VTGFTPPPNLNVARQVEISAAQNDAPDNAAIFESDDRLSGGARHAKQAMMQFLAREQDKRRTITSTAEAIPPAKEQRPAKVEDKPLPKALPPLALQPSLEPFARIDPMRGHKSFAEQVAPSRVETPVGYCLAILGAIAVAIAVTHPSQRQRFARWAAASKRFVTSKTSRHATGIAFAGAALVAWSLTIAPRDQYGSFLEQWVAAGYTTFAGTILFLYGAYVWVTQIRDKI